CNSPKANLGKNLKARFMGKDNKLHIILLGRRNSGKSSLINALTGQNIAIVSDVAGTTTDLVKRSYEIPDFASVIFIDTAGIDDTGTLGEMRVETRNTISQADMAYS
ncbi:MAG: GTPase, partial [Butyricimonas faecihominis]